ncbi:peptidase S8 [Actinoallomurus iriomotensis]|uniref:Peptidase S8 n=2 Tax=Actinoallomurus iriomotensis TaxID=478107 RepID=A0A9W6RQ06_9ACTN|nr:peptidase S8 [Actinoallomurus iriomotensis]
MMRLMRIRLPLLALMSLALIVLPSVAAAQRGLPYRRVCEPSPGAGRAFCLALFRSDLPRITTVSPGFLPPGYGPAEIRDAYRLPTAGFGRTVAIVVAFDDPSAEQDLAVYRNQYGLPPCTTANGCFRKIDQNGGTRYPPSDAGWAGEASLDMDAVSAACPYCRILLVEANDNFFSNLFTAEDQAVAQGARFVSNSWGANEFSGEELFDRRLAAHSGVAFTFASGDQGYGHQLYPAASPYVTAVGGTSLVRARNPRGWVEGAWSGAGSGCSPYAPKPSFQRDLSCPRRTAADVSADADPMTGLAVYDSFEFSGWRVFGGTSASAPLLAAMYALAGVPGTADQPSSFPYARPWAFNDIVTGANGSCGGSYLCTAVVGYDGPTGIGTPNGVAGLTNGPIAASR